MENTTYTSVPPKTDYEEKLELVNAIHEMQRKMERYQDQYDKKSRLLENLEIVKNRKSSVLTVFIISVVLRVAISEDDSPIYISKLSDLSVWTNILLTLFILVGIPAVYYAISRILCYLKVRKYKNQLKQCDEELKKVYNSFGPCPIGYKYALPSVVSKIEEMIVDGRADTVKEAINVVLSDEQYSRLMDYQEQIAKSGKQTAAATTATAFFAWRGSHWSKKSYKNRDK